MMDPNKAVQYQNPAHVHAGTSESTFTVASGAADNARLTAAGIERVGTTTDLPLELAAQGKAPVKALGGSLVVGLYNTTSGGYLPRPYTADPVNYPYFLYLNGGDYTAEFSNCYAYYTDGDRLRYCPGFPSYNAELNRTEIFLMGGVTATSGFAVGEAPNGLVAGFGNIIVGSSIALGYLCLAAGRAALASGLASWAFGDQSLAVGSWSRAMGNASVALGFASAAGSGSCAFGSATVGWGADGVASIVEATVTISGDVRSHFTNGHSVLIFNSVGRRLQTNVASVPAYANNVTTFAIGASPDFTAEYIVDTGFGQRAFAEGYGRATGDYAHAEGYSTLASGAYAHSEGYSATAAGSTAHAEGGQTAASAQYAHAEGYYTTASATAAHASGYYSAANKQYQRALASGRFAANGDSQYTEIVMRRATTNATPAELTLTGAAPSGTTENTSNRFICATGKTYACLVMIAARKSDGTSAFFIRQVLVKNVGGTVSLEGEVQTVGVDINPAGWNIPAITADNTNKSLMIVVTGLVATNIRWSATIQAQEIYY